MAVYLDNAATSPVCKAAREAFDRVCDGEWGNSSALHDYGVRSAKTLNDAKRKISAVLGMKSGELLLTSGGTESNNTALLGVCEKHRGGRVIVTAAEHASVAAPAKYLLNKGFDVVFVPYSGSDERFLEKFCAAITPDTVLASVMSVNNETGLIYPVTEAARLLKSRCPDAVFHTDAVQAFCKCPISLQGVDLCSMSGHKIGAPQGIGALYIAEGVKLAPRFYGGHQQNGLRPGTEPVAMAAAFGAAAEHMSESYGARRAVAEHFGRVLREELRGIPAVFNPGGSPFIYSLALPGVPSEVLMRFLQERGILVSAGAACSGGKVSAAGRDLAGANASYTVRISLGEDNLPDDARELAQGLSAAAQRFALQMRKVR